MAFANAQTIQLGSGTATSSYSPNYYLYNYSYSQTLYTAAEMHAQGASLSGGTITKIRFKPQASVATTNWRDWVVYLGNTTKTDFTSTTDWIPVASMTQVFAGQIAANVTANQWMEITLTTPFAWDGSSNIVVAVDENTSTWGSAPEWAGYTGGTNSVIYYYSDETNPDPASPPTASSRIATKAQIQFDGTLMDACAGMPTGGTTTLNPTSGNTNSALTGTVTGATSATGLTYQWQYSDDGGATWVDIAGQTNANLATNAMGVYGTRQYRRAIACGTDVAYSAPATFVTELTYCAATTTSTGDYVSGFSTTGAIANLAYTGSVAGYVNKTTDTLKVIPGSDVNFTVSYVGGNSSTNIWIDFDGSGTFEPTEKVNPTTGTGLTSPYNSIFSIPGTTPGGAYRMRVRTQYGTSAPPACGSTTYGTIIDYTVRVINTPVAPAISQDGATPTCPTGTNLLTTGTPGTDEAWYWQTTATGTSTANDATTPWNVMVNGTYYVRAYNTLYNLWGDAESYVVSDIPVEAAPSTPFAQANPACYTTGTDIFVAAATGDVINYWQGTDELATSMTDDATTPYHVSTTGTYYVKAYNTTTECWSEAIGITVNVGTYVPVNPIVTDPTVNVCIGATSALVSAQTGGNGDQSLLTSTAGGNGCSGGAMFDITATGNMNVVVKSIDALPNASGAQSIKVYYKNGSYLGSETNQAAWTLVGTYPLTTVSGTLLNIDIDDVTIPSGSTYGFYINYPASYTTVTAPQVTSNADITITSGAGLCGVFSSVNANRAFNGRINYITALPADAAWFDQATGGNMIGTGSPFETIGSSVLPTATEGSYEFYVASYLDGCESVERALVTVNVNPIHVDFVMIDATCNNGMDGSFDLGTIHCGTAPFEYSVDGGAYSATIPTDLFAGPHTVQVKDANGDLSAVYNIVIGGAAGPANVTVTSYSSDFATITWTATGAETSWNVEWGAPGFTPGTGTAAGSAVANAMTYTIAGLTPETEYDIYVSSNCGGPVADWAAATVETDCAPLLAQGYCEDFEDIDALGCWKVLDVNADGDRWSLYSGQANSGNQSLGINTDGNNGSNNDYIVLPRVTLTGNEIMTFHYKVRSASEPNNFEVVMSNTGFRPVDFTTVIMADTTVSNIAYESKSINLSQYVGNYYIAFHVPNGGLDGWILYVDDVCIDICIPTPGINGTQDVCRLDGSVQLNDVITSPYTTGQWSFPGNQSLVSGDTLNVSTLANGTHNIYYYVTTACTVDTTIAIINVFNPSSAGVNGVISACKNQMIDLYGGLSGNVDFGGTWYAPNGTAMAGSYFKTGNLIGQQVYKYVVSNGVCDADTSEVTVNITNCDFMGVDAVSLLENVTVAPNPNTGKFQIMNIPGADYVYEVVDVNGRVVRSAAKITSTTTDVNITDVENGVYMIRIYGNDAERMIRVIKH